MGGYVLPPAFWEEGSVDERHIGFTAIVDKALSAKYETLVQDAPELIKSLPWGKDFEVDVFRKPDFTALEVVTFATGGSYVDPSKCTSMPIKNMQVFQPASTYDS